MAINIFSGFTDVTEFLNIETLLTTLLISLIFNNICMQIEMSKQHIHES